ncbi:MAG: hypothetical protein KDA25_02070 [Phycisphaerales bacterium]|nr:hypothetical protein [Phycisphaerales bacterium]
MITVNLIPVHRLAARRRQRVVRAWVMTCSTLVAAAIVSLVVSTGPMQAAAGSDVSATADEIRARLSAAAAQRTELQDRIRDAASRLTAIRLVSPQPDWSVLIEMAAAEAGPRIALARFQLDPMVARIETPGEPVREQVSGFSVRLAGHGREERDVFDYVLRLESANLFAAVSLVRFRREGYLGGEATSFELQCVLSADATTARNP